MPRFRFEGLHHIPALDKQIQKVHCRASICEPRSILIELVSDACPCPDTDKCCAPHSSSPGMRRGLPFREGFIMRHQGIEPEEARLGPTLGLTMMVKNEADFIVETLNSTKDFIDHWTIVDTGGALSNKCGQGVCDFSLARNALL